MSELLKDLMEKRAAKEQTGEPASPDESGMAMDQAKFIGYVSKEIMEYLQGNNDFPEWMQNKLTGFHEKAKDMHAVMAGKYESVEESLRKDIAAMSAKFPEGSKVRMKHDGKVAKVVSVGKDFVKVAVGNKTMDHKPSELEKLDEAKATDAQIHKVLGPTKNAKQGIEALKKAFKVNDKEAEALMQRVLDEANRGSDSYRVKYKGDINTVRADSPEDALKKSMKAFGIGSMNKKDYMKNASAISEAVNFHVRMDHLKDQESKKVVAILQKAEKSGSIKYKGESDKGISFSAKSEPAVNTVTKDIAKVSRVADVDIMEAIDMSKAGKYARVMNPKTREIKKVLKTDLKKYVDKGWTHMTQLKHRLTKEEALEEKLEVSDGLDQWIKDFQASDAPQFADQSKEEIRNMAIAAYLAAKKRAKGDVEESSKAYGKSMDDTKKKNISNKDKKTLSKLADLMAKEKGKK